MNYLRISLHADSDSVGLDWGPRFCIFNEFQKMTGPLNTFSLTRASVIGDIKLLIKTRAALVNDVHDSDQ